MPNALQHETSPYLLQHADNPVDWHPWNPEALELAQSLDKPILLSIGYSACHWCHVMAHESFEDAATAALMNELFVNIKVDREERPDLDRIYQTTQQLMTGRPGGWPLTVFLTPDQQWPIFCGTYFPKQPNYGMPSFGDVLERVAAFYRTHRSDVDETAGRLREALARSASAAASREPGAALIATARRRLGEAFDAANGGLGQAPKFPHPTELRFLLTEPASDDGAARIADASLRAMAAGGLFDHLGGGFFRYSVDAEWRIPHFEKMLYDNAALLGLYSEAFAKTGDALYGRAAAATADWMLTGMQDAGGGFYSTLDADSEGEEGRYYVFSPDEVADALSDAEREPAFAYFGLDGPANFEGRAWHLQPRDRVAPFGESDAVVESARSKLLALRTKRIRPGRDEKILTAWNGLAVTGLARAARHLNRPDLGDAACRAVDFIRDQLWRDGRLYAVHKDGQSRFVAYLDDYAFMAHGLIELLQWRFRAADLGFAVDLVEAMLENFADPAGGFFFTAHDHEQLIHRPKPLADEAVPSGNGVAAIVLNTLGHLLGEPRYLDAAAGTIKAAAPALELQPEAHTTLLDALRRQLVPPVLVIVRGDPQSLDEWRPRTTTGFTPQTFCFFIADAVGELPGLLDARAARESTTAYICEGTECLAPITDIDQLAARLTKLSG